MGAVELTLILRFEDSSSMPRQEDLEEDLDCVVIEYIEEDV